LLKLRLVHVVVGQEQCLHGPQYGGCPLQRHVQLRYAGIGQIALGLLAALMQVPPLAHAQQHGAGKPEQ